ncbi:MAG: hypothetical protein Q8R42_01920 [Desulfocapsaceae bacterium]|nr:hypothetical protein [Desulfocapsaceae bacterium]
MALVSSVQGITESPLLSILAPDSFFRLFVQLNYLKQVSRFLFLPGMLFNDTQQWWGTKKRKHPHEGIDIYLTQSDEEGVRNILPQMLIPAILPGYPVHFHRDFLGETLYSRHPEISRESAVLHTIYGHGQFNIDLNSSSSINKGDILGTISDPPATSAVPAHLHISCAWIQEDQRTEELNWEDMAAYAIPGSRGIKPSLAVATNRNVHFIDPLPFLLR